jgi:hypothetical protein
MRACDFVVRAFGPRRSHSSSRRTRFASVSCQRRCSRSAALEELAVGPPRLEEAARVHGIEVEHALRRVLEEPAVVADDEVRPRVRAEERLEPEDTVEVEMVRRLVHEEEVGRAGECLRDREALLPAAREGPGRAMRLGEAAPAERHAGARVALDLVDIVRNGVADDPFHAGSVGERWMLRHVRERRQAAERDRSHVGLLEAGEHPEQRRLARAVRTDESDPIAVVDPEGDIGEKRRGAERLRDPTASEEKAHRRGVPALRRRRQRNADRGSALTRGSSRLPTAATPSVRLLGLSD